MGPVREEYKGHRIELRVRGDRGARGAEAEQGEGLELLIDDEVVRYGRLPDGRYALHEYAYDWSNDLTDLARKAIEYRDRAGEMRAKQNRDKEG